MMSAFGGDPNADVMDSTRGLRCSSIAVVLCIEVQLLCRRNLARIS